jgi:hypothetical protein
MLAAIFGLIYLGLSLYGAFGIFQSVTAVNVFYFVKSLVAGVSIAVLICLLRPKGLEALLCLFGVLFAGINLLVIAHHALRRFAATSRGFWMANGLLIGASVVLAIFLWWAAREKRIGEEPSPLCR